MTEITIRKHAQGYTLRNGDNHVVAACSTREEALELARRALADLVNSPEPPSERATCFCPAGHECSCCSATCPRRASQPPGSATFGGAEQADAWRGWPHKGKARKLDGSPVVPRFVNKIDPMPDDGV